MYWSEHVASCIHPLLLVSYLVLNNSFQTQQNQEQGLGKNFLALFMHVDTRVFPPPPGKGMARQSSEEISHRTFPNLHQYGQAGYGRLLGLQLVHGPLSLVVAGLLSPTTGANGKKHFQAMRFQPGFEPTIPVACTEK